MQHKISGGLPLLDKNGKLNEPGYANELICEYRREEIKASKLRIKEWDYYLMVSDRGNYALALCIDDNGYMGLANASFYDFTKREKLESIVPVIMPMGKMKMPSTSGEGNILFQNGVCRFEVILGKHTRHLKGSYKKGSGRKISEFDIMLEQPDMDTMVIATPWKEDEKAFYYNQKINCMRAEGYCIVDGKRYEFNRDTDFGTLDWGRGVWTYDNTWKWGSGNAIVDGHDFGYNIGYGFGDTTAASENMIFYDGQCHKLDRLEFIVPDDDIMKPWKIVSSDGRFDMDFVPVYDNRTKMSAGIIAQDAHQVYGRISGNAVLDDGKAIELKQVLVFNEIVHNRY